MKFRSIWSLILLVLIIFIVSGLASADNMTAPDRIWIRLDAGFYNSLVKAEFGAIAYPTGYAKLDELMEKYGVKKLEPVYIHNRSSMADPIFLKLGMEREYRFISASMMGWVDPMKLSDEMKSLSVIEDAAPIYRRDLSYTTNDWSVSGMDSWGIDSCHARQAWNTQRGDSTVLAVTIDTGVNYNHPDLWPNIAVNPLEDVNSDGRFTTADNDGTDADGNGFVDDVIGWNFVSHNYVGITNAAPAVGEQYNTRNNNPFDVMGHGTHVCGSIAARTDNSIGVSAASFNVKTICIRAGFGWVDSTTGAINGSGYDDDFEAAIQYAILRGARIISISFGGTSSAPAYQTAITYARSHNCLVLAAAGNANTNTLTYPGAYTGVMAVAALDHGNIRASFSNYGTWVDISAPGVNIWSTMANNQYHATDYAAWSGTSMATPTAASVAALVLSRNPAMTSDTLEAVLRRTATNINAINPSYVGMLGVGLVNADSAVRSVAGRPVLVLTSGAGETWMVGSTKTLQWSTSGAISNVKIELNRSFPSATWETIIASTANTGSYNWTVAGASSGTARIRVSNVSNSSQADTSDFNATIRSVLVTSPNGGENRLVANSYTVTWLPSAAIPTTKIELNRSYPSATWETIIASTSNTGLYNWTVAGLTSGLARIRISNTANSSQADTSDADFIIAPTPTSLTEYFEGAFAPSSWRSTGIWAQFPYSGNNSGWLDYYDVNAIGTHDSLFTYTLDLTGQASITLNFSTSYALYTGYSDSLFVVARYANGAWNSLWRQGGATLANRTGQNPTAWRSNQIALPVQYQTSGVQFAFVGYNGYGEDLYLDSVKIVAISSPPKAPRSLVVTQSGSNMNLQWSRVDSSIAGQPITVTGYKVYAQTDYLSPPAQLATINGASTITYTHTNAVTGFQYVYTVTAFIGSSTDSWRGREGLGIQRKAEAFRQR